jgi:YesN/AraC family two-component response regulator
MEEFYIRKNMPDFESMKLLFVEDQQENAMNYISFFQKYCYKLEIASDGLEAYQKYKEFQPDIILLDINMSKMDGIEVLKKIRKKDSTTRIIMFTAHSENKFIQKTLELGVTKYLLKPVTRDELREALVLARDELKDIKSNLKKQVD